jgi:hypothetical protein
MEKLAKIVAKEIVSETFLTLGLDIRDPISVQNQFATLRNVTIRCGKSATCYCRRTRSASQWRRVGVLDGF